MNDDHLYRMPVLPVKDGTSRPLWSVMIPTYNCAKYLREALTGVLVQDPGTDVMQIEVVDDHSTDDPVAVVEEMGSRVRFYSQVENVGHVHNFNTCLNRSQGQLIHILHGDDCVRDGFYQKLQRAFVENPDIGAAFCRQIYMDEHGHWQSLAPLEQNESGVLDNWLEKLAVEQRIMTPSMVVRREVYEKLGGFDSRLICSEDWEMWVRIAAHYPVWYEVEPLAVYRMHSESNTGRHIRTGEDMKYTRQAINIFTSYLPENIADRVSKKARETYALSALDMAYLMLVRHDMVALSSQIQEAVKLSCSYRVLRKMVRLILFGGAGWVWHKICRISG